MNFIIRIIVVAVNAFLLAAILPGINIASFSTAIWVALVLAVLNFFIKPILLLLTLPATILTLGLFIFVINALVIMLDAYFVHGFRVTGFWPALLFSILLSFANSLVLGGIKEDKKRR